MGIIEEVVGRIVSLFFCRCLPKMLTFCSFLDLKAGNFFDRKRLKPLYVNALKVNHQAIIREILSGEAIIMAWDSQYIRAHLPQYIQNSTNKF